MWARVWAEFGPSLGQLGAKLGQIWTRCGTKLGPIWDQLGPIWGQLGEELDPQASLPFLLMCIHFFTAKKRRKMARLFSRLRNLVRQLVKYLQVSAGHRVTGTSG